MQQTFSDMEYGKRYRKTRKDDFLEAMQEIIPWEEWVALIEPHYYPDRQRGRKPLGIEKMLRMYLLQCWFNLSDEGVEDAIYDSYAMRKFMGINFLNDKVPDATTLLHFRHLMEEHGLGAAMFAAIKRVLDANGLLMHGGTIVDATIISAPTSTKNAEAANLIRPDDEVVYGDSGYLGIEKREEIQSDAHLSKIDYRINRRPGKAYRKYQNDGQAWEKKIERQKSSVRSKVEHPYRFVKVQCGYKKTVYRGIKKNLNRLHVLFACANLYMCICAGRQLQPLKG